ncbi:MAG: DNA mismatch repair protein MutS [Burkholderiales bacterium]|nr:MAG: DNA mismatch repair protein MutS [Burkholderiales bacterium]
MTHRRTDAIERLDALAELGALGERLRTRARQQALEDRQRREQARRQARENDLFHDAVADAVPLAPTGRVDPQGPAPAAAPRQRELDERAVLDASLSDEIDIERYLETDEALSYRRHGIGPEIVRRLRRGEWVVKAQIDLHGLRVDEAREALTGFLNRSLREESRCVRVIHGKGLGSAGREPVLKLKVPRWLVQRQEVLAFCQARPNDGGAGALIVLLRLPAR